MDELLDIEYDFFTQSRSQKLARRLNLHDNHEDEYRYVAKTPLLLSLSLMNCESVCCTFIFFLGFLYIEGTNCEAMREKTTL